LRNTDRETTRNWWFFYWSKKGGDKKVWLRFIKNTVENKIGDVVWVEDDEVGQKHIDAKEAGRCTGPDGVSFEEAAPEDIEAQIKAEEKKKKGKSK